MIFLFIDKQPHRQFGLLQQNLPIWSVIWPVPPTVRLLRAEIFTLLRSSVLAVASQLGASARALLKLMLPLHQLNLPPAISIAGLKYEMSLFLK